MLAFGSGRAHGAMPEVRILPIVLLVLDARLAVAFPTYVRAPAIPETCDYTFGSPFTSTTSWRFHGLDEVLLLVRFSCARRAAFIIVLLPRALIVIFHEGSHASSSVRLWFAPLAAVGLFSSASSQLEQSNGALVSHVVPLLRAAR